MGGHLEEAYLLEVLEGLLVQEEVHPSYLEEVLPSYLEPFLPSYLEVGHQASFLEVPSFRVEASSQVASFRVASFRVASSQVVAFPD